MTAIALPQTDRSIARAWLRHGGALAALLAVTLAVYHRAIEAAVQVWWVSPTYSHCFLILPIVLWLVWEKRAALAATAPSLFLPALLLAPLLGLVWWLGQLSAINEVQQYAVMLTIQSLVVALFGLNIVRLIWFPILYLIFMVPTGEYLIVPMQHFAAQFVDVSLTLLNIPHFSQGTMFELTNGRFEIAEACAGLRFLIATVTLAVLFSYMMFRKPIKIALFLLASVAVPLVGNGLRCVGIILLAHFTNNEFGAGADHIVYGWGFNVAILLILGVFGSFFRDDIRETATIRSEALPVSPAKLGTVAAIAALLVSVGPAVAFWHDNRATSSDLRALSDPFQLAGWQKIPPSDSWHPSFSGFDAEAWGAVMPANGADAVPVDLYLAYYARPRPGHSMTAHVDRFWDPEKWNLSESGATTAPFAGTPVRFQESIITSRFEKRMVWSSYWVNGRFTTSTLNVKLWQSSAALNGHEGQAALVFSTQMERGPEDARRRLASAVAGLNQLPARLNEANRPAPGGR
jgi:exosortase A